MTTNTFASLDKPDEVFEINTDEINPSLDTIENKRPAQFLRNESIIQDTNSSLGVKTNKRWTGLDHHKLSGSFHLHGNYESLGGLTGFEVTYLNRRPSWDNIWWGATIKRTQTYFKHLANNPDDGSSTNADSAFPRPSTARETLLTYGLGMAYRFKFFLDFFKTQDVFENVQVFATYNQLNESYLDKVYQGYGMTADYAISKRSSSNFFYGGKLSYNLALVTREAISDEKVQERSLSLGWFSLAFEMGYLF